MPEPLGWWPLDEGAGMIVDDEGTGMVPGELVGDPVWAAGHIGGALAFDGVDDLVLMEGADAHDLEEFTMAAWVWIVAPSPLGHPSVLDKGTNFRLRLDSTSTRPGAVFHDPDANEANEWGNVTCRDEQTLPREQWHHIAATYGLDDRTLRVFVDGTLVCTQVTTGGDGHPELSNERLRLGFRNGSAGVWFNGTIDDVRLYDHPLTSDQIQTLADM